MKDHKDLPAGWDQKRLKKVLDHYEQQSEDEAVAEDKAGFEGDRSTVMRVPADLVPKIRDLIAKHAKTS